MIDLSSFKRNYPGATTQMTCHTRTIAGILLFATTGLISRHELLAQRPSQQTQPYVQKQLRRLPLVERDAAGIDGREKPSSDILPRALEQLELSDPRNDVTRLSQATPAPAPSIEYVEPLTNEADVPRIPRDYVPWWESTVMRPHRAASHPIDVDSLVLNALQFSPTVHAINVNASIRRTAITEADAEFDVHAFMESKFVRTSEPTGTTLEAGANVSRLREEDWFYNAGIRRKNTIGGTFEVAQRFGLRDSNSTFFTPLDQGNARFTLNYSQPILNGFGKPYNQSLIVLANIDTQVAWDRTSRELQDHLLKVTEAHWQLFQQRAVMAQKHRHFDRAKKILGELEGRRDLDSMESQIARARSAVASRRTELIRTEATIRNAEARIRALINSPVLLENRNLELIPQQPPVRQPIVMDMHDATVTALQNRPEIDEAMQEIRAAGVRMKMAKHELLPALDLVLETYMAGLQGDYDVGQSFVDQFSRGEPGYSAGLVFEVPLYNRAARARYQRRQLELQQLSSRLQAAIESLNAEVEVAVREVNTTFREMESEYHAMLAAENDVSYLQRRWELLPGEERAASFALEDLLDSQDRLNNEEFGFVQAQINYTLSLATLQRAMGTLLQQEHVLPEQIMSQELPVPIAPILEK